MGGMNTVWLVCDDLIFGCTMVCTIAIVCSSNFTRFFVDGFRFDTRHGCEKWGWMSRVRPTNASFNVVGCDRSCETPSSSSLRMHRTCTPMVNLCCDHHHPPFVPQAVDCHHVHSNMHFRIDGHRALLLNRHFAMNHAFSNGSGFFSPTNIGILHWIGQMKTEMKNELSIFFSRRNRHFATKCAISNETRIFSVSRHNTHFPTSHVFSQGNVHFSTKQAFPWMHYSNGRCSDVSSHNAGDNEFARM